MKLSLLDISLNALVPLISISSLRVLGIYWVSIVNDDGFSLMKSHGSISEA